MRTIETNNRKDHLCTGCHNNFVTCHPTIVGFGDGEGNDNVIKCSEYNGPMKKGYTIGELAPKALDIPEAHFVAEQDVRELARRIRQHVEFSEMKKYNEMKEYNEMAMTIDESAAEIEHYVQARLASACAQGKKDLALQTKIANGFQRDLVSLQERCNKAERKGDEMRVAATWVINLLHGVGKRGGSPESSEWSDAIESFRIALATPAEGLSIKTDASVPLTEIRAEVDGKEVGRIVNLAAEGTMREEEK